MKRRRSFQPNLADSALEDRTLLDATQTVPALILTTGGYILSPSGSASFSSSLGVMGAGASVGSNGMNISYSFYITGFGLSVMTIGNVTGYPVPGRAGIGGTGTSGALAASVIIGTGATGGSRAAVSSNAPGQSLPLNPGTGFLYIGQALGPGTVLASAIQTVQNETSGVRVPVAPVAPMGPIVSAAPSPSAAGSSAQWTPTGPGFETPSLGAPPLSGTLPAPSNINPSLFSGAPPLSGTLPTLRGTLPTLIPGPSR